MVLRPRLTEQINEGLHRKLTLVSAPVGYGKTTILSEWIPQSERCVTWVSLDEGDNDPVRFWAYFIAALQKLDADIGKNTLALMRTPSLPPIESILTILLNEIAMFSDNFALVLDDYHVIEAKPIDKALTFLLEHLPPQMHVVITTREDPNLPLAQLRAQDQLTELRAADLRFTPAETAIFLKQVMNLDLSAEDITTLEDRTEGWIAGLQLAALSMRGREDVHGFIRSFTGDNRFIVEYLVEQVLQRQSEGVRSFLLQTSILDRLSGALCDAVTGQEGGSGLLETLERGNLFISHLDDKRYWFRYHPLFAGVLQTNLISELPDRVPALNRRASAWYEQNGSAADAIRHALAAEDFERAADLIELAVPAMRPSRQEATMFGWLKALPDELYLSRPVLSVYYAAALLLSGELEAAEARLRDAERWLDPTKDLGDHREASPAEMVVVDQAEFQRLPGWIAIYRAAIALALGDVQNTIEYARLARDLVPEGDHLGYGASAGILGIAYWTSGDLEAAHQTYADGMASLQRAGYLTDAIGSAIALADIRIAQGFLSEAMDTYQWGLQLATEQGTHVLRGAADMHVGMSELCYERNELNAAIQHLLISTELGQRAGLPKNPYRWCVAMARIRQVQGDPDGALDLLCEAEGVYSGDFFPNVRPIEAIKARVWVTQGRLGEASDWARERGLAADDRISYLGEFEHITLARVLLARYQRDCTDDTMLEAMGLLDRLLQAAEEGGRLGSVIEILILQALAQQMQAGVAVDLTRLERALMLAEEEGYIRIFVDEGNPMAQLLREAAARGIKPDFIGTLLAIFEAEQPGGKDKPAIPPARTLNEPLSARELEVLQLTAQGLSNREISKQLFLALNTIKGHNRKIFDKLQVERRTEAVARARELGLL